MAISSAFLKRFNTNAKGLRQYFKKSLKISVLSFAFICERCYIMGVEEIRPDQQDKPPQSSADHQDVKWRSVETKGLYDKPDSFNKFHVTKR